MDLVWICRHGENEELRYSMRSAVENLEHENVWVIGDKPNWYSGNFIQTKQIPGQKYDNVKRSLIQAIDSNGVSDNFALMNDDFYTLKPVSLAHYYSGTLQDKINRVAVKSPNNIYSQRLQQTMDELQDLGIKEPLDYEMHIPMKLNKMGLSEALEFPQFRSAYGNLNKVGGQQITDVKVYSSKLYSDLSYNWSLDSEFLSSDDGSFTNLCKKLLEPLFPSPTIYERN